MTENSMEHAFRQPDIAKTIANAFNELAEQGWFVVEPKSAKVDWLPEPLRRFEPDLVARRGDEIAIVEVKAWPGRGADNLDDLAETVAALPNTRLEVHWLGGVMQVTSPTDVELLRNPIAQRSAEARALLQSDYLTAAVVISWSAAEGALLRYAGQLQIPLPEGANGAMLPWRVLAELDSRGYINDEDMKRLTELRRQRNAAAHFAEPADPPSRTDIEYCLDLVDRMLSGRYVSVDQMIDWYTDWAASTAQPQGGQAQVRSVLAKTFPGASSADLDEAVAQLFSKEAP